MADRSITNTQQVARAGEYFVAAELHRRGAYAVPFAGNMPRIDLLAGDRDLTRTVSIQVKAKAGGSRNWHAHSTDGRPRAQPPDETRFWVLVDLNRPGEAPDYFVIPEWWMQNDIHEAHRAFLGRHGGKRPRTPDSTHHSIDRKRVEEPWHDRWDVLGIFPERPGPA